MFSNRQYRQSIGKVSALINKKARQSCIPASRAFSKEYARDVFEKVDRPVTLFAEFLKIGKGRNKGIR